MFRYRCGLDGDTVFRPDWRIPLEPAQVALLRQVDGRRTIREIVAEAGRAGETRQDAGDIGAFGRNLFRSLWQLDFLAMGLKP